MENHFKRQHGDVKKICVVMTCHMKSRIRCIEDNVVRSFQCLMFRHVAFKLNLATTSANLEPE